MFVIPSSASASLPPINFIHQGLERGGRGLDPMHKEVIFRVNLLGDPPRIFFERSLV